MRNLIFETKTFGGDLVLQLPRSTKTTPSQGIPRTSRTDRSHDQIDQPGLGTILLCYIMASRSSILSFVLNSCNEIDSIAIKPLFPHRTHVTLSLLFRTCAVDRTAQRTTPRYTLLLNKARDSRKCDYATATCCAPRAVEPSSRNRYS